MTSADLQATFVATLVDEWVRSGVTDAVVAPGSRSTPVVAALAADGRIRLHVVLDERAAGFVALGIGAATGRPAPVVTTSGTAAVELHPAVVEAHQAGVPFLAVTADRPAELHHVGAPQTVEQVGLYGPATRWAVDPGVPTAETAGTWRSLGARCVADTVAHPAGPGPVHLNLQLREPLLGTPGALPAGRPGGAPWHATGPVRAAPDAATVDLVAGAAGGAGLIVAGAGCGDPTTLLDLAETLDWPVLADPRSGCRVAHPLVVGAADAILRAERFAAHAPAMVLRVGRPWASKVVAGWLAGVAGTGPGGAAGSTTVVVDPAGEWADPDRTATVFERADPTAFCAAVVARVAAGGRQGRWSLEGWSARWSTAERAAQAAIDTQLAAEAALTEAAVARSVLASVPDGGLLVTSSSMPVRDVEWFGAPRSGVTVLANRGANGIDGVVATSVGVALGTGRPTVALVGDLAFLYDAGALLGAAGRDLSLTVVVVDNDGGGIFSFLPQATALPPERFERFWGTPHGGIDLTALAAAYGARTARLRDTGLLAAAVGAGAPGVHVVVVPSERAANVAAHKRLNAAVVTAVGG